MLLSALLRFKFVISIWMEIFVST